MVETPLDCLSQACPPRLLGPAALSWETFAGCRVLAHRACSQNGSCHADRHLHVDRVDTQTAGFQGRVNTSRRGYRLLSMTCRACRACDSSSTHYIRTLIDNPDIASELGDPSAGLITEMLLDRLYSAALTLPAPEARLLFRRMGWRGDGVRLGTGGNNRTAREAELCVNILASCSLRSRPVRSVWRAVEVAPNRDHRQKPAGW
jgi:hypothetical protein